MLIAFNSHSQTGPGGVHSRNGSSPLQLWMDGQDLDGDGKFTRSNPVLGQLAEPVLVHKKPIKIKSNWTHEIQF